MDKNMVASETNDIEQEYSDFDSVKDRELYELD